MSDIDAHSQLIISIVMESVLYWSQISFFSYIFLSNKHIMKWKSQRMWVQHTKLEDCILLNLVASGIENIKYRKKLDPFLESIPIQKYFKQNLFLFHKSLQLSTNINSKIFYC